LWLRSKLIRVLVIKTRRKSPCVRAGDFLYLGGVIIIVMTSNYEYFGLGTSTADGFDEMWEEKTKEEKELDKAYNSDDDLYEDE
jgi:hypothetical protein